MNPIIMRVNLSEDDKYDVDVFRSSQTVEEFRASARDLDPNNIQGELLDTGNYPEVHDQYEDSAAFHATLQGLRFTNTRVGYVHGLNPDSNGYSVLAIYPPGPIKMPAGMDEATFEERLQELDNLLRDFIAEIDGINDPQLKDLSLAKVKASAAALRDYIDIDNEHGPLEVPREAATTLQDRMEKIDWSKYSEQLRIWGPTIVNILVRLLGL